MNVLFVVPYPKEGASNRYRVEQYIPFLTNHNIKSSIRPFIIPELYKILYKNGYYLRKALYLIVGLRRRIEDIVKAQNYDIIFIHREACNLGPPIFERLFSAAGKPIIFDFDDAIYLSTPNLSNRLYKLMKCFGKTAQIIKLSNHVIVCNNYLKKYVQRYNSNVTVIPTSVDTDKFRPANSGRRVKELVIGWIGSHTSAPYLAMLTEVFQKLRQKYDFLVKIVGAGKKIRIPGVEVLNRDWSLQTDVEDFQSLDIGVYPLEGNEWDLGKTGFKTVQYMAVGIPAVVSRVGSNMEIVQDGVNGFLASGEEEWIEKLSLLIEDPNLRKRIGLQGRHTVEQTYSVKANAPRFLEVLDKVYAEKS